LQAGIEQYGIRVSAERTLFVIHPFYSRSYLSGAGNPARVAIAFNPAYNVEVWTTDGKLERLIRRPDARRAPSPEEKAAVYSFVERYLDNDPITVDRVLAEIPEPDSLPAIAGLVMGQDGAVLVQSAGWRESEPQSLFDVYDSTGRWMAEWRLPRQARALAMGTDYILVVRRAENDIPLVEVYRIRRG
jgi:hypothetical protein